jgi:hypothetical protein
MRLVLLWYLSSISMPDSSVKQIVETALAPHLLRSVKDDRPVIVMTCGMAGTQSISELVNSQSLTPYRLRQDYTCKGYRVTLFQFPSAVYR